MAPSTLHLRRSQEADIDLQPASGGMTLVAMPPLMTVTETDAVPQVVQAVQNQRLVRRLDHGVDPGFGALPEWAARPTVRTT